jgi:streptogramin lyase
MNKFLLVALASTALAAPCATAQQPLARHPIPSRRRTPLPRRPNFFKFPKGTIAGEASAVAVNSKAHIFLFQQSKPMLAEYDAKGNFVQSLGDGLFSHPHGLRVDSDDNLWTTDDGNHLVLKLNPAGNVRLVLGRINTGAEANWRFNKPADIAFARSGDIYVADGYGNFREVKFDR